MKYYRIRKKAIAHCTTVEREIPLNMQTYKYLNSKWIYTEHVKHVGYWQCQNFVKKEFGEVGGGGGGGGRKGNVVYVQGRQLT